MTRCQGCAKQYETPCGCLDDADGGVKPACPHCNRFEGTTFDDYNKKIARIIDSDGTKRDVDVTPLNAGPGGILRGRSATIEAMPVLRGQHAVGQGYGPAFAAPTSTSDILSTMRARRSYLDMKIAEADACRAERKRLDKMIRAAERVVAEERLDAERAVMASTGRPLES